MTEKFLAAFLMFSLLAAPTTAQEAALFSEPLNENFTLTVPGLGSFGDASARMFFLRDGVVWNGESLIDLKKLKWPDWDQQQIPYAIVPVVGQKHSLLLYDKDRQLIETIPLKKNFSIEDYNFQHERKAAFYQFAGLLERQRINFRGRLHEYKGTRSILSCEADIPKDKPVKNEKRQIDACLDSFKSYLQNSPAGERRFYVKIFWPRVMDRTLRMSFQTADRDLRRMTKESKALFLSTKNAPRFTAELGLIEQDNLKAPNFYPEKFANFEAAQMAPASAEPILVQELVADDGSSLQFFAHANDRITQRTFESMRVGHSNINLQMVAATVDQPQLALQKTPAFERRTGLSGLFRKWTLLGYAGWNSMSSNRGDEGSLITLPGIAARYNSGFYSLYPFVSFERNLLNLGSDLTLTEFKVGVEQKQTWLKDLHLSVGYHQYGLSGKNTGASRLGGVEGFSFGASILKRSEDYLVKPSATIMYGNTYSYSVQFELGKIFPLEGGETLYVGPFIAYTVYRGMVLNRLAVRELFTENRAQVGLAIGIVGLDSY